MSRRKQGRPQQRKALDSLEQENDLLVCGDCQTNFPLNDIVKFIRHKVNRCNKKNVDSLDSPEYEDGDQAEADTNTVSCGGGGIGSKCTSISAPIARKESIENRASPRASLDSLGSLKDVKIKEENGLSPTQEEKVFCPEQKLISRVPLKPRQVVDAESNTTHTEPSKFVCDNCKSTFCSAWSLLQHAQKEHGMRIYTTPLGESLHNKSLYSSLEHHKQDNEHIKDRENRDGKSPHHHHHSHHHQSHHSHSGQPLSHSAPQLLQLHKSQREDQRDTPGLSRTPDSHRTPPSASSAGTPDSGSHLLPPLQSPHNPFMFRFPFDRPPLSPGLPFCRPPVSEFQIGPEPSIHRGILGFPPTFDGPSPPFSSVFDRPPRQQSLDNQLESFYSQRLRQLANTSGSPSPVRKHTPPFSTPGGPSPTIMPPLTPPSSLQPADPEKVHRGSGSLTPPTKLKSCEFCGKSFRFQSNLIVHRRSHTGEKPFKCPLCPHACTQQSKLKRHMKTHMNKSPLSNMSQASNMSEGSLASGSSTPDSSKRFIDDEDEEEEEEEEEEMDEELEIEEDDAMIQEEENNSEKKKIEVSSSPKSSELAARLLEHPSSPDHSGKDRDKVSPYKDGSSLLSEVMKNTGLTNIQTYNEAFKQALAERASSPTSGMKESASENGSSNSSQDGIKEENKGKSSSDSESESPCKKVKHEPPETPIFANNMENNFYSLWGFPAPAPTTEYYHLPLPGVRFERDPNHNGFSPTNPDSALKSLNAQHTPKAGPSNSMSGDSAGQIVRKESRRNDTCEYCGKIFKNCSNLTVHRRSHTGEKPYKCVLCSYACAQSSKLTRHMKTHGRVGKDVYKCKFCLMPFSVPSTLEKHMRKCVENRQASLLQETDSDSSAAPSLNCGPDILQESMSKGSPNVSNTGLNHQSGLIQEGGVEKSPGIQSVIGLKLESGILQDSGIGSEKASVPNSLGLNHQSGILHEAGLDTSNSNASNL